jgi:hypothetical protein
MACKLLRKCHKEEAHAGVIAEISAVREGDFTQLEPILTEFVFG